MNKENTCQVCEKENEKIESLCSGFGAVNVRYCPACLREGAEPLWMIHGVINKAGGEKNVAAWAKQARSFHGGKYIDWSEIVRLHAEIKKEKESDGGYNSGTR